MTRLAAPITTRLDDEPTERVRRAHHDAIVDLQNAASAIPIIIPGVVLANATATTIAHGLGKSPRWVGVSAQRGGTSTGRITDLSRNGSYDRSKVIALQADGWTVSITVDVAVIP